MGFYLGYALSLYSRAQDRLSHVLVNSPFESHSEFFYPTPESRVIHRRPDGRPKAFGGFELAECHTSLSRQKRSCSRPRCTPS